MILSDFTWVSAQRWQGSDFTMVPHSLVAGGLMVPEESDLFPPKFSGSQKFDEGP